MKFLMLILMTMFVGACAHHKMHGDGKECGCGKKMEQQKDPHECKECDGKKAHGGDENGKRACCSEKSCTDKRHDHGASCKMEAAAAAVIPTTVSTDSEKITQQISKEEFAKMYTKNKETLGKTCSKSAVAYCGKTTKDLAVSEGEASCLWTKVYRVSREVLPELDGTPCAKTIKSLKK